jgi:hypothetical protein
MLVPLAVNRLPVAFRRTGEAYIELREIPAALQARLICGLSRSASSSGSRQANIFRVRLRVFIQMPGIGRLHISGMAAQLRRPSGA